MLTSADDAIVLQLQSVTITLYAYVGIIMFIMGTIGNLSNIVVFLRLKSLKRLASSWFLLASFVGSQCVLGTGIISLVIYGFSKVDPLTVSTVWCKVRWTLGPAGGCIALCCISLASIDRYLITSRQVNRHRWMTVHRAQLIILVVILVVLLILMPNAIFYTNPSCRVIDAVYSTIMTVMSLTVYTFIPLTVLGVFCALTWRNLRGHGTMAAVRRNRLQQQVNRMMIAQICVVVLTSVPSVFIQVYSAATRYEVKTSIRVAGESLATAILNLLGFTVHSATFYVYMFASQAYRNNVKSVFCLRHGHSNRVITSAARQQKQKMTTIAQ